VPPLIFLAAKIHSVRVAILEEPRRLAAPLPPPTGPRPIDDGRGHIELSWIQRSGSR
jgi:hypothetical protein